MLTIVVECGADAVAEEVHVETVVLLECLFPTYVRVVFHCLVSSGDTGSSRNCSRLCVTEEVAVGVGERLCQTVGHKSP